MKAQQAKSVNQQYYRYPSLPHVELRCTFQSHLSYKAHFHHTLSIGVIEEGCSHIHYGGNQYVAQTNELILIEPMVVHSCNPVADSPRSYQMLYLDTTWCLQRFSSLLGRPIQRICCDRFAINEPTLLANYRKLSAQLQLGDLSQIPIILDQFIFMLLSCYCSPSRIETKEHDVTLAIRQQLYNNIATPPSLSQLAETLSLRPETLIRIFQHDMGITPKAFLNNLRIEQARQLLQQGYPLAEVAQATGFSDQSHFHKLFVLNTAATPGQYQQPRSISDNNSSS